jgi:hypothetical protein
MNKTATSNGASRAGIPFSITALFVLFSVVFYSCKTSKKIVESPSAQVKLKGEEVIQIYDSVIKHEFLFNYFSAKANVDYTDKSGDTKSFDINLRIKYDTAIWISITPLLGIEAARLYVTRDSVIVLDRVHKTVMRRDFGYFEDMLKTNVNYDMIQAVVVGNYFQYLKNEKLRSLYEEDPYVILSSLNKRQARRSAEEKDPNVAVVQDFWIDGNYRIAKSRITDNKRDRWVEASYKNFIDVSGYLFPSNLVVTISSSSPTIMKIDYNRAMNLDSLQMPFSVPDKYEPK